MADLESRVNTMMIVRDETVAVTGEMIEAVLEVMMSLGARLKLQNAPLVRQRNDDDVGGDHWRCVMRSPSCAAVAAVVLVCFPLSVTSTTNAADRCLNRGEARALWPKAT